MRFSRLQAAGLILFLAGTAAAEGPRPGAALGTLKAVESSGPRGGHLIDGAPLRRPALTVEGSGAGAFGARALKPSAKGTQDGRSRKQEPFVPDPDEMQEATAYKDECTGFMSCLGSAVVTPIKLPFEMMAMGGALGYDVGSGLAWAPGGIVLGALGALVGFAAGLILAPISFVGGLFKAFKKL